MKLCRMTCLIKWGTLNWCKDNLMRLLIGTSTDDRGNVVESLEETMPNVYLWVHNLDPNKTDEEFVEFALISLYEDIYCVWYTIL